jgi:hypothetical protein
MLAPSLNYQRQVQEWPSAQQCLTWSRLGAHFRLGAIRSFDHLVGAQQHGFGNHQP